MQRPLAAFAFAMFAGSAFTALSGSALAEVNVNTAQQSELQRTKGLDKQKAKTIIEYRAQHGHFDSLDDLEKLPGFSQEVVARIAPEVTFTGDAYVPPKPAPAKEKGKK